METNSLFFSATKTVGNKRIDVKIRLNDECKNGHQDFSITGDTYEKAENGRFVWASGGCIHEEIEKYFPQFSPFIRLHLCDYDGTPMHAVANGFYHLTKGFNKTKPYDIGFMREYCEYYRISPKQFKKVAEAKSETHYALLLEELRIREQWRQEAAEAIKQLEKLTGKKFINDSKRSQWYAPTPEEIEEHNKRMKSGYYTTEQVEARNKAEGLKVLNEKIEGVKKEIETRNLEIETYKAVYNAGGARALEQCIFYTHTRQIRFNWKGYDELNTTELANILNRLQLPEGVTIDNKKR